jgi:hypothetical protein
LKTINEQIAEKSRLSKQLEDEALAAQRERDELVAQSDKNREFLELREHMLKLVGTPEYTSQNCLFPSLQQEVKRLMKVKSK